MESKLNQTLWHIDNQRVERNAEFADCLVSPLSDSLYPGSVKSSGDRENKMILDVGHIRGHGHLKD
jgi:hypothetical protein